MKIDYPRFMKTHELIKILNHLKTDNKPQYQMIFLIQASLGLRISEICNLKLEHINKDFTHACFYLSKQDKAVRRILPQELGRELQAYTKQHISNIIACNNHLFFTRVRKNDIL